ncbi:hypothetical protein C8R44DRAFT_787411, partial [Mycena epipterygia]
RAIIPKEKDRSRPITQKEKKGIRHHTKKGFSIRGWPGKEFSIRAWPRKEMKSVIYPIFLIGHPHNPLLKIVG